MNRRRLLQFSMAKGIGPAAIRKLLKYLADNGMCLEDLESHFSECLTAVCSSPEMLADIYAKEEVAGRIYKELSDQGIRLLVETDKDYPRFLIQTQRDQCPPILFAKGNIDLLNSPSVGFCGSRKTSLKGLNIAQNCVKQLVDKQYTIVSGYASGTDITAHRKALQCGGNTIFVLAEGILRFSIKRDVKDLLDEKNHVFISQFLPSVTWNASNAMKRNSVIIGLSRAMVLIESSKTGGTFAAGEEALRVKCPLFVIDYAQPESTAEANRYFIKSGGIPIRKSNGSPSLDKLFDVIDNNGDRVQLMCDEYKKTVFVQTSMFQDD